MKKFKLSTGEKVLIKSVMIDVDGTNLEEGINIYINNKFVIELVGVDENTINENTILNII